MSRSIPDRKTDGQLQAYETPTIEVLGDVDSLTGSGGRWWGDFWWTDWGAEDSGTEFEQPYSDIEAETS